MMVGGNVVLTRVMQCTIVCDTLYMFYGFMHLPVVLTQRVAPAQRAMTLHSRDSAFMILPGSKFAGNPSPEVDQAWKHLLKGICSSLRDIIEHTDTF